MSFADMLEDSFPHSTPEGYKRGCRGSRCRGIEDHGWSCTYAMQQYRGDYHWRQWVDQGATAAEIAELRKGRGEAVVPKPAPTPEPRPQRRDLSMASVMSFAVAEERPKPRPVPNPARSVRPVPSVEDAQRWRVDRKGPGAWRALGGGRKRGRVFPTHGEAFTFAYEQAAGAKPSRPARPKDESKRTYTRLTPKQIARGVELRGEGMTWPAIAEAVGAKVPAITQAVTKMLRQQ